MMRWVSVSMLGLMTVGCQPAGRYAPPGADTRPTDVKKPASSALSWIPARPVGALPIRFVSSSQPGWQELKTFWNPPLPIAGVATIHVGLTPLPLAIAWLAAERGEAITIKVPLGLPDPTPFLPAANLPTLAKWTLGKKIFFDDILSSGGGIHSCASCHHPATGFSERRPLGGRVHTPSLFNAVYQPHFFWDGRATSLEETIFQSAGDEILSDAAEIYRKHRWGSGLVGRLNERSDYRALFREAFGVDQACQDFIAKALATYVRTILSGNALYDQAEQRRKSVGAGELLAEHFEQVLKPTMMKLIASDLFEQEANTAALVAKHLEQGARIFFESASCVQCHPGPLFQDRDFHNLGLAEVRDPRHPAFVPDRFEQLPIGLKEPRQRGAFRTPGLRGLAQSAPYFHLGQRATLQDVVNFFMLTGFANKTHDSSLLRWEARRDQWTPGQAQEAARDLIVFLRALDGEPVDVILSSPLP